MFWFVVMTQLTGSAPCVSNFVTYSGVLIVIVRFGAALKFATCRVCADGGTLELLVACSAGVVLADGLLAVLGFAPGCAFFGSGAG